MLTISEKKAETRPKRIPKAHRWDPELLAAVDDWRNAQEVPPTDISVIETAVKAWLAGRGAWPRKPKGRS